MFNSEFFKNLLDSVSLQFYYVFVDVKYMYKLMCSYKFIILLDKFRYNDKLMCSCEEVVLMYNEI